MFSRSVVCWLCSQRGGCPLRITPEAGLFQACRQDPVPIFHGVRIGASALHQSLVQRGPTVNGDKAYAATEVAGGQDGSLWPVPSGCRIQNYRMKLDFTMRLPKLRTDAALSPAVRSRWQAFESFMRNHEARHRDIWISCAANVEKAVRTISTRSCEAAQAMATGILNQMWKQCARKHDAFDAAQRHP